MRLETKLSAKEILGPVANLVKNYEVGEKFDAFALTGKCSAYETGVSKFGEWVRFVGDMYAINYVSGEEIRAESAHIPRVLESLLMNNIGEMASRVDSKCTKDIDHYALESAIEFAFMTQIIRLEDKDNGAINYKFVVTPLTEVKANDNLAHLTALLPKPTQATPETE